MDGLVDGRVDPAFQTVRDVFEASFTDRQNVGAAVAVFVDGRAVVDLWGGVADSRTRRPWERDTPAVTFSCTKAVTATAALAVAGEVGRGWQERVTTWWPEYGVAGKEATTLADMLTHRAGLPAFDRVVSAAQAADPAAMAALLAGQRPVWVPGAEHGYHALTFGWLVGEFVRRHTGVLDDLAVLVFDFQQPPLRVIPHGRDSQLYDRFSMHSSCLVAASAFH